MLGRKKDQFDSASGSESLNLTYNDKAGAFKQLGPIKGHLIPMGNLGTQVLVNAGSTIWVFNSDTAIHYVITGASGLAAPTGPANGIPVPPGEYICISNAGDNGIRSDSALVFGYLVDDETVYNTPTNAPIHQNYNPNPF